MAASTSQFISFVIVLGLLVFSYLFSYIFIDKKRVHILRGVAKEFSGSVFWFPFPISIFTLRGKYNGNSFKISIIERNRYIPSSLNIYFYIKPFFNLTIQKESSLMRFGKKIGFIHEIETHDPDFDREFLCLSSNKSAVLRPLSRTEVKQAIKTIFAKGFTVLKIKKYFLISKRDYVIESDVTAENIRFILEQISIIARGY